MKILIENIKDNPANLMRRAGYSFQRKEGEEMSFVRPFSRAGFPRFHAYIKQDGSDLSVNIHFDAKKETYGKASRHHGEYEDEGVLKEEVERLESILRD